MFFSSFFQRLTWVLYFLYACVQELVFSPRMKVSWKKNITFSESDKIHKQGNIFDVYVIGRTLICAEENQKNYWWNSSIISLKRELQEFSVSMLKDHRSPASPMETIILRRMEAMQKIEAEVV